MSRNMIAVVIAASAIFASCNRSEKPVNRTEGNANQAQTGSPRAATANPASVTILLSGLMVLHKDEAKGTYEVGIVPSAAPHKHEFTIRVDDEKDPKVLPANRGLTIEITNSTPTAPNEEKKGHAGRRPDDINGQYDFDWVVDLETDFHKRELTLKKDKLYPIIHLPNGTIKTKYKSIDLQRNQGGGAFLILVSCRKALPSNLSCSQISNSS